MKAIRPGKYIFDNNGSLVQAHGGSIIYVDGTFYRYGENKEGVTGRATGVDCPYWHNGVRMYSSKDLYNWRDEGIILVSNDPNNPFCPTNIMDRPHIVHNAATHQFVLWAKVSLRSHGGNFDNAYFAVATAASITGPYTLVREHKNIVAGDFDIAVKDGKAYIIYEKPHTEMICAELTDDYLDFNGTSSTHIPKPFPPYTREAPCFFEKDGRMFIITSGTTGYFPNESITYEIADFHGEYIEIGPTCVGDSKKISFGAQFSSVFKHPHKDLYIALGDKWLTDLPQNPEMCGHEIFRGFFDPSAEKPRDTIIAEMTDECTALATYIDLPISFDEKGNPQIKWKNNWKVEDYE